MPVFNPLSKDRRQSKLASVKRCDGCGSILPKGSMALIWSIWQDGQQNRYRLCSKCQNVIYGCKTRRSIDIDHDDLLVRDICESCDGYLTCPKVQYLKERSVGEITFDDLPI